MVEQADLRKALAAVQENHRRWVNCPRHFFPARPGGYRLGEKLVCANCQAERGLVDIDCYVRGWVAHGGDPADIMPDWHGR